MGACVHVYDALGTATVLTKKENGRRSFRDDGDDAHNVGHSGVSVLVHVHVVPARTQRDNDIGFGARPGHDLGVISPEGP